MTNVNDEMKATADYAIKSAKERFGQDLDLSEQSINKLDNLLSQAYQSLSSRAKDEKTNLAISKTASIWGTYLGEIMRQIFGGSWALKGSERILTIKGLEFSPISFVLHKITNHPEYSIKGFIDEANRKISPPKVEQPQPQKKPKFTHQPSEQTPVSKQQNSVTIDKRVIFAFAGIGGVLLLAVVCIVGFFLLRGGGISAEFRTNLNNFLVEAEKLNVLTEQGVSNGDFRNQLAEVKSAYSVLNGSWPSSLSAEKSAFDQAIKGWELTLEVWDLDMDGYIVIPENSTLLKECTAYANLDPEYAKSRFIRQEWIGILMEKASQYFEQGQASINSKLK